MDSMKSLSPATDCGDLRQWLERAAATREDLSRFTRKLHEEGEEDRKAGRLNAYAGDIETVLED
jgi:hypothetical protein